jgi:hypothetical protein
MADKNGWHDAGMFFASMARFVITKSTNNLKQRRKRQ